MWELDCSGGVCLKALREETLKYVHGDGISSEQDKWVEHEASSPSSTRGGNGTLDCVAEERNGTLD